MRVVIVYESLFGNTHHIAESVRDGFRAADPTAEIVCASVGDAAPDLVRQADLLVVGGPTHMRSMSRTGTRRTGLQAEERKAAGGGTVLALDASATGPGVRGWLATLPGAAPGTAGAAFDTRADERFVGGAAHGIARQLRRHGYRLVAPPEGFIVEDSPGPLRAGERERATAWGAAIADLAKGARGA